MTVRRPCPPTEAIAAYLDGTASPRERAEIEAHAAGCADCTEVLAAVIAFQEEARPQVAAPLVQRTVVARRAWLAGGLAAGLAFAIGLGVGTGGLEVPRPGSVEETAAAAPATRPLLARVTGGYPWAPQGSGVRGVSLEPQSLRYAMSLQRGRSVPATEGDPHALADASVSQLLLGHTAAAIEGLFRASTARPHDPAVLADFAAARMTRGLHENDAAELAAAYELTAEALALTPDLPEARFNQALLLEQLHLDGEAKRAWHEYLGLDAGSAWAEEARTRLEHLARRSDGPTMDAVYAAMEASAVEDGARLASLVRAHRHQARRLVQERLLPLWGTANLAGRTGEATRLLRAAAAVAAEWQAQTGDPSLAGAVAAIEGAADAEVRRRLAIAHEALGPAQLAIPRLDLAAARDGARLAMEALDGLRTPASTWARLVLLACAQFDGGAAVPVQVDALRRSHPGELDVHTRARVEWILGVGLGRRGDLRGAIGHYQEALALYERLDEKETIAHLRLLLSEVFLYLGERQEDWGHRRAAVALSAELPDRQRSAQVLKGVAISAIRDGEPRLGFALLREMARDLPALPPVDRVEHELWQARAALAVGDRSRALAELARATRSTAGLTSAVARQQLTAELAAIRGAATEDSLAAVAEFSEALAGFRAAGLLVRVPEVLLDRAEAHASRGELTAAERDVRAAVASLRESGDGVGPAVSVVDRVESRAAAAMAALQLRRGRADLAFASLEQARLRSAERLGGGPAARGHQPIPFERLPASLPSDTTVVAYALLSERVVAWRVSADGVETTAIAASPTELRALIKNVTADLANGAWTPATRRAASRLYERLIDPLRLANGDRLAVVADAELHDLPFSALVNPRTGRYLLEEREVVMAPSATEFVAASQRLRGLRDRQPTSALVLGASDPDPVLFPSLPPLANARREALSIAAGYDRAALRVGLDATAAALAEAGDYEVVHFAGHALPNSLQPWRAALALAPGADGTAGALFADEIGALPLSRTRLVVLAACGTADGPLEGAAPPLSLARGFLTADVPSVVATLWPVDDGAATELSRRFHEAYRTRGDAVSALRTAQLALLRGSDPGQRSPVAWAAFEALGG